MAENIVDAAIAYDCWRRPLLSNSKVSSSYTRFMRATFLHPGKLRQAVLFAASHFEVKSRGLIVTTLSPIYSSRYRVISND